MLLSIETEQTMARDTVWICLFLKGNLLHSFFFFLIGIWLIYYIVLQVNSKVVQFYMYILGHMYI